MADQTVVLPLTSDQSQQGMNNGSKKSPRNNSGLLVILFALGCLIIGVFILNYYNILPVSQSVPALSFLPKQQEIATNKTPNIQKVIQKNPQPLTAPSIPSLIRCPVSSSTCSDAIEIFGRRDKTASFSGIGVNDIFVNEPIMAAIDGDIKFESSKINQAEITLITIENKGKNIIVNYELPKNSFKQNSLPAKVKEGDRIGILESKDIKFSDFGKKFNLIFYSKTILPNNFIKLKVPPTGTGLLSVNQ